MATATFSDLREARGTTCSVSNAKLLELQRLAGQSIGVNEPARVHGLVFAQKQLIAELKLLEEHQKQIEAEVIQIIESSREGKILTSLPGIGPMAAAVLIATIGNFDRPAQLKSYFGWARHPSLNRGVASIGLASHLVACARPNKPCILWFGEQFNGIRSSKKSTSGYFHVNAVRMSAPAA